MAKRRAKSVLACAAVGLLSCIAAGEEAASTLAAFTTLSAPELTSPAATAATTDSKAAKVKRGLEALQDPEVGSALDPHPDPNDENYEGMIYVGRLHHDGKTRLGFDVDNGIKYIFGTSFDETHKQIEESDLHHEHYGPDALHDLPDHAHGHKTREQVLHERRHGKVDPNRGPKPFGYMEPHPLDGGETPPKVVHVDPFFMDHTLVTNKQFGKFVRATYYETEAEQFGWSFVLSSFVPHLSDVADVDPEAEDWAAVDGAYWRQPEGPGTSYKFREHHPVVHVSHRDAAEYCRWVGKRLPGEWEWEAAARAGHFGPTNRTLFSWGEEQDWETVSMYANLWGEGDFPWENKAEDGWRGTSPVMTFPPNAFGFYDMTGNVWEWMRGGKHKARIVRGGSYVDGVDGSFNHAATLGARSTLHGTTSTANVGFRCVKSPKRRVEYHYVYHDEAQHGTLGIEDQFGKKHMAPQRGWEDQFEVDNDDSVEEEDEFVDMDGETVTSERKKRKVIKTRSRISNEL